VKTQKLWCKRNIIVLHFVLLTSYLILDDFDVKQKILAGPRKTFVFAFQQILMKAFDDLSVSFHRQVGCQVNEIMMVLSTNTGWVFSILILKIKNVLPSI